MNIIARTGVGKCNLLNIKFTPVVTFDLQASLCAFSERRKSLMRSH